MSQGAHRHTDQPVAGGGGLPSAIVGLTAVVRLGAPGPRDWRTTGRWGVAIVPHSTDVAVHLDPDPLAPTLIWVSDCPPPSLEPNICFIAPGLPIWPSYPIYWELGETIDQIRNP